MRQVISCLALSLLLMGCAEQPKTSPDFPTAAWQGYDGLDAPYILWTGDTLDVDVATAPELSREDLIIAPDGRISMPLIGSVRAAGRSAEQVRDELMHAMSSQLLDPRLTVSATAFGSQRVFVGGQVDTPGIIDLPGQIGPFQAIIMAGGLTSEANAKQVLLMRRIPGGEVKTAIYNIHEGILDPAAAQWGPLQRFDIVYVSTKWIAKENLFVQQYIRNALPVDFSLVFDLASSGL
ncbi:MAG: polysaccharide biosynthesis/export family protein [Hyphomonadaceae bacterium]